MMIMVTVVVVVVVVVVVAAAAAAVVVVVAVVLVVAVVIVVIVVVVVAVAAAAVAVVVAVAVAVVVVVVITTIINTTVLPPRNKPPLGKLTIIPLVKKFSGVYGKGKIIFLCSQALATSSRYPEPAEANPTASHPVSLRAVLILCSIYA
jgi:hypothetical protein